MHGGESAKLFPIDLHGHDVRSLFVLLCVEEDVFDGLVNHILRMTVEVLTRARTLQSLATFVELRCGVLLQELLSLNLEEVAVTHLLVGASMLLLDRASFMGFQDIPLASLNSFFKKHLSLLGATLLLIIEGACFLVVSTHSLELLIETLNVLNEEGQVLLLIYRQLANLSLVQKRDGTLHSQASSAGCSLRQFRAVISNKEALLSSLMSINTIQQLVYLVADLHVFLIECLQVFLLVLIDHAELLREEPFTSLLEFHLSHLTPKLTHHHLIRADVAQ